MILTAFFLELAAFGSTGFSCASCSEEARQFIDEVTYYLDEFTPEIEYIEDILESEDVDSLHIYREKEENTARWYAALIPSFGIKIFILPLRRPRNRIQWELFILWRINV